MRIIYLLFITFLSFTSLLRGQHLQNHNRSISVEERISIEEEMDSVYEYAQQFFYTNLDSTQFYSKKVYDLAGRIGDFSSQLGVLNQLIISDNYVYDLHQVNKDIEKMDSLIQNNKRMDTVLNGQAFYNFLLWAKGNYFYKTRDFYRSEKYFKSLITEIEKKGDSLSDFDASTRWSSLEFLGEISRRQNKLSMSQDYYNQIKTELEKYKYQGWKNHSMGLNSKLSKLLVQNKDFRTANDIQIASLNHFKDEVKKDPKFKNSLKSSYQVTIENYLQQDSLEQALFYIKESYDNVDEKDPFKKQLDLLAGDAWLKKLDFKKAESYYKEGLDGYKSYRDNQKHPDIAEILLRFSDLEVKKGNFSTALKYCQQALVELSPLYKSEDISNNPSGADVSSNLVLLNVLAEKIFVLGLLYENEMDKTYLEAALNAALKFVESFDALKPEYESKVDKQFLITEMYPALQDAVEVCYKLFSLTKDDKFIKQAFFFVEKSKSILLLEATRSAQANSFGGIPDEVLNKERQYRASILYLEKNAFTQNRDSKLSNPLFRLKTEYYDFVSKLEHDYPRYFNLKYKNEVASVEKIRDFIGDEFTVLDYFVDDKIIYVIQIQKSKLHFDRIMLSDNLKTSIERFYEQVSNFKLSNANRVNELSFDIYNSIIKPSLDKSNTKKLIVISDDILNYLPFDALTTKQDGSEYLLDKYVVSYANSATLLLEDRGRDQKISGEVLAFAPQFQSAGTTEIVSDRSQFAPLKYNQQEVKNISTYFKTKSLIGTDASINNFNQFSSDYKVLHFATHASANDEYPDYSFLALASDKKQDSISFLYVKDLYTKDLNAELITLSACETGIGKFQRGEGILSLARGFNYAGAKSLVTSLWKVNDETTSQIMNFFYKNLDEGQSKNEALRNAKLEYLRTADDSVLKHPYFWAGFVISGDMSPIGSSSNLSIILIVGVIFLVTIFILYKRYHFSS